MNSPHAHTNRLAGETSPYLLQHAHNPVDWYAWGSEAFAAARAQDKPIFLSVGYSTCYWCHVMERQCFENPAIATEMNRRFINIKVDREERPDVDQLYMTAVQVMTRQGGWPMSVFLTPQLEPFYGGTYFPPEDAYGRPGFPTLLAALEDAYKNRRADVRKNADRLTEILRQVAEPETSGAGPRASSENININAAFLENLIERSTSDFDPKFGGFGRAPKFPRETLLELLLMANRIRQDDNRMQMLLRTLDAMADGGIRDHLGGGFHRYSTDAQWLVPHFEIMLYDNAMLAWVYAEAYAQTEERRYAAVARGICDFVLREMTSPDGAFYTALDAEVDGREGLSYLWTRQQVVEALGAEDAALFNRVYGLDAGPNFADPHHSDGRAENNILFLPKPIERVAAEMHLTPEALEAQLEPRRKALYALRRTRKQPLLDTKVLTSWNALMSRGLAHAGDVLDEPRYVQAAAANLDFLLREHQREDGGLFRTSRDGVKKYDGFLDDYAYLAVALLALADSGGDVDRTEQASGVVRHMLQRFSDARRPGALYFSPANADDLIIRQKTASDSPLPSGNAMAAMALLELDQRQATAAIVTAFADQLESSGEGMSALVEAALLYVNQKGTLRSGDHEGAKAATSQAASAIPSPQQTAADVLAISADWKDAQTLRIAVTISDGFHINAHDASAGLHATQLAVSGAAAPLVEGIAYPAGAMATLAFADEPIRIFSGKIEIVVKFREPMTGRRSVALSLFYQACNDQACLTPTAKSLEVAAP